MWKLRNDQQHANDDNDYTTTKRLRNQISSIFIEAEELNPADQSPFNSTGVEEITALPVTFQQDWIKSSQKFPKRMSKQRNRSDTDNTPEDYNLFCQETAEKKLQCHLTTNHHRSSFSVLLPCRCTGKALVFCSRV